MNKFFRGVGLATGVLLLSSGFVPSIGESFGASDVEAATVTYKTVNNVNLRSSASWSGKVITVVKKGTVVEHVGISGGWIKVKVAGKVGYVPRTYVKKISTTVSKVPVSAVPASVNYPIKVTTSDVNLYSSRITTSKVLTQVPKGSRVEVLEIISSWVHVRYGTTEGYIPLRNLADYFVGDYATTANLSMYDARSTGAKLLVTIPKGTKLTMLDHITSWYKVEYNGQVGFVAARSVMPIVEEVVKIQYQTTDSLNMRSGSSVAFGILQVIPSGSVVDFVSDEGNGWYKISYNGVTGFVSSAYLTDVKTVNVPVIKYTEYPNSLSEVVDIQFSVNAQTDAYRSAPAYVLRSDVSITDMKAKAIREARVFESMSTASHVYGKMATGTTLTAESVGTNYVRVTYGAWRSAKKEDIVAKVDPSTVSVISKEYYQFLDLSASAKVSAATLDKALVGKGILDKQGQAFIDAGRLHGVNEVYLMSHALLETGHGTSTLARGVLVSEVDGKPVTPRVVYNMYGIGAIDSSPLKGGSEYAYKQGWFSPAEAIIGGAKFIGSGYINNATYRQNTLYKMRWNPSAPGTHQYATDIGWAAKQTGMIYDLYQQLDNYTLTFDVPKYR